MVVFHKKLNMKKRVVITGIGCISSLGNSIKEMEINLTKGNTRYLNIPTDRFSTEHRLYRNHSGFLMDSTLYSESYDKSNSVMFPIVCRSIDEALKSAGIEISSLSNYRTGLCYGTSVGASYVVMKRIRKLQKNNEDDFNFGKYMTPILIGEIASKYRINGIVSSISTACASGTNSIGRAADMILNDKEDMVICGGIDVFTELTYSGFNALMALSKGRCNPLSEDKDGMSLGDACASLILESYESAICRNAHIFGEIKGYCILNEAYHATAPKPDGEYAFECMKRALDNSGLSPNDIDYINAHGTGTYKNDTAEICGLEKLLVGKSVKTAVNSTKGLTGHCLGAAGSIEVIICLLSMKNNTVYAYDSGSVFQMSETIDFVFSNGRHFEINNVLSNSFGFGGNMASIVLSKII